MRSRPARLAAALLALLALTPAAAGARGRAGVAALQVALSARGLYAGTIDGYYGPLTRRAVRGFQRRRGLTVDGIAGLRTRRALGRRGRPALGARPIRSGMVGWDVAALQFALAWHGFPSGGFDGGFGPRTDRALRRFQRFARLPADGVAGPLTLRALARPDPSSPIRLAAPVRMRPIGDRFGPRGARFHAGLDFPAPQGWNVRAAGRGRVVMSSWLDGFGRTVIVAHRRRVRTLYAHLSGSRVVPGERVAAGERIAYVGATGRATGPHLHFEVIVRGAEVDPLTALR
jgi:peptidoglycan hydrolase-like protein with peptidoglycan-binding domain